MNDIEEYYETYDEVGRLTKDRSHSVEFSTISETMDRLLCRKCRVLDIAAGPGTYAFHLADMGHSVSAKDLSTRHIRMLQDRNASEAKKLASIEKTRHSERTWLPRRRVRRGALYGTDISPRDRR